ncbi:MAG: T9SS type A sorting domain-containing protein [Bacteroidota bacterium]|nr:T9SS type A sorting domain-containing protein [Bacteroidota bacterium]MDP4233378.1 T9SS type A sorting domain-containing protein [Bacteroidota bacterium]MDP4242244.1 T9SS type A sorting domain-containing protein [Bacteroidota bacterium]MDP4287000.1 T9SS type A sorting domain-containing protein [Bacteroidota bacterium]
MDIRKSYWRALWVLAFFAMSPQVKGQKLPGTWQKVVLPVANYSLGDFAFADSLHGIAYSFRWKILSTIDGGKNWVLDTDLVSNISGKSTLNTGECTGPHRGFFFSNDETVSIAPGATAVHELPNISEQNWRFYVMLGEKMYDTSYGFRVAEYVSTHDENDYQDSVVILVTHDGWQSSQLYGNAFLLNPAPHTTPPVLYSGTVVDSNDIWMGRGALHKANVLLHTSNAGTTWDTLLPVDTNRYKVKISGIQVNPKTHEVCILFLDSGSPDYAYSSDYGKSWRVDSTFGQRLWRLANPAPGILWAMIGQGICPCIYIDPPAAIVPSEMAHKLAYSSNNGATWTIDSATFASDSLEEMHFIDARHGWIASWSHDSVGIWYYNADAESGVIEDNHSLVLSNSIYPNPVRDEFTVSFTQPEGERVRYEINDALGHAVARGETDQQTLTLSASNFPSGVLLLRAEADGIVKTWRFVVTK